MMEAGWSAWQEARQLGHSDCVGPLCLLEPYEGASLKDIWDHGTHYVASLDTHPSTPPFAVVPNTRKMNCRNQVVFSDKSRFNLSSDDNGVRVWRPRGERLNPTFALQRHTALTAGGDGMGFHCLQYTVPPRIDPWHHDHPEVCS
ncbi:transposable element Tcb2 transposase [Trichonephila clavipes]|uniref:Transposable element Tcb2 transposase n=1 Tax=Trichonephila clavipes TaxID=2585209 RepID=A0A8X6VTC1_TRICX|nr:transposable element Tcb2 transposase [Trichonephila clavipes]